MPIVKRALTDLFVLAPYVDVMVNAVNCVGAAGKGIALEFKNRHPQMYERYRKVCLSKELHIGKIQTYRDNLTPYTIVNLPTKNHYADASDPEEIKRGLLALCRWLDHPTRRLLTIGMPMLGCGEGKQGYDIMEPIFFDYLDHLDNVIHLSMWPEKMDHIPKYLGIIGPRDYTDYSDVEAGVFAALDSWGMKFTDFDAIVSGGARGVDTIACGSDRKDKSYEESLSKKYHPTLPIICKADWNRLSLSAGMIRNRTVVNIITHCVAILPPGYAAVGTSGAVAYLWNVNKDIPPDQQKLLYIHGEMPQKKMRLRDRVIAPNDDGPMNLPEPINESLNVYEV